MLTRILAALVALHLVHEAHNPAPGSDSRAEAAKPIAAGESATSLVAFCRSRPDFCNDAARGAITASLSPVAPQPAATLDRIGLTALIAAKL